jgi:guanine deaminase
MNPLITPEEALRAAIRAAIDGVNSGAGGPFGAVVVRGDEIIGRGCNSVTSTNDPTAHAEIVAIRAACKFLSTFDLTGCSIYASCEPCPMCAAAIYWARLDSLTFAVSGPDAAELGFDDEWIRTELALPHAARKIPVRQLLRDEGLAAFEAWRAKADKVWY